MEFGLGINADWEDITKSRLVGRWDGRYKTSFFISTIFCKELKESRCIC